MIQETDASFLVLKRIASIGKIKLDPVTLVFTPTFTKSIKRGPKNQKDQLSQH